MTSRRKIYLMEGVFSIACVAIVRDHYLFLLKQECEDRVRFAINSARVYPLLQLHYYIQIPTWWGADLEAKRDNSTLWFRPPSKEKGSAPSSSASGGPPRSSRGIFLREVPLGQRKRKWSTPPKKLLEGSKPFEKWFCQGTLALPPAQVFFCRPLLN